MKNRYWIPAIIMYVIFAFVVLADLVIFDENYVYGVPLLFLLIDKAFMFYEKARRS